MKKGLARIYLESANFQGCKDVFLVLGLNILGAYS
ncbi:protein of unknown function [Alcaligenes faecalis subsp. faecalis]|nr:protein of unknown function [Alcaligenes faecalis subsp. faecalis]